ncbi:hypothetical protein HMPREF3224_01300 [Anaerococcus hydrogenalis]|nr:hypothetical protein HMPREF3224_01300 [Anaerococcus hydrogenalis]
MRGLKKFTSLLLALFIFIGNIVTAFADEIVKSNEKNVVEQSSQSNEENTIEQNSQTNEENQKNDKSEIDSSNILTPSSRNSQILSDDNRKPKFNETRIVVRLTLHGLNGKNFDFEKIYPNGLKIGLEGECNKISYKNEFGEIKEFSGTIDEIKSDVKNEKVQDIDFGIHSQLYFKDNLPNNNPDRYIEAYPEPNLDRITYSSGAWDVEWTGGYPTTVLTLDLYQSQNTELNFKTIGSKGEPVDNPDFGKFIYKIGNESRTNNIPTNASGGKIDPYEGLVIDGENFENFNGSKDQKVTLENANVNGFISQEGDDFAYKILDQKQKDDDKSNPLEVTLIKKQKVIKGGDHPKYKDPTSGKEVDDPDYVKVEFKVNAHGAIESGESVYWVLKDLDVKDSIKAPKVDLDYGYGFKSWSPWFNSTNQKYSKDTSYVAIIKEIKYFDYLTYSGDTTTNSITFSDASRLYLIGFVDRYGIYKEEQIKSFIDLEDTEEKVRVTLENGVIKRPGVKKLKVPFQMKVDNSFGDAILDTTEKQLKRETTFFANDIYGNASWWGIRYTIKNQNTKGIVTPKEKETLRYVALTKEEIYEAVKNGKFTYNDGVPDQNKSGDNALHRVVDGENLLNPDKVKKFNISDEDYKKLDFLKLGEQEVPVTITYLDNSKSTVNVKIKIKKNVPTGIIDDNNQQMPKILLFLGVVGVFVSVINFRKKFLKNYE